MAAVKRPTYPSQYEVDVLLKDGSTVRLRPARPDDDAALAATLGEPPDERIIAVGLYTRLEPGSDHAEVAFTVEDSHQGRGIATQLLDHLAIAARDHDIRVFEADVLGENRSMLDVFRDSGFPLESRIKYGTYHVAFPIEE